MQRDHLSYLKIACKSSKKMNRENWAIFIVIIYKCYVYTRLGKKSNKILKHKYTECIGMVENYSATRAPKLYGRESQRTRTKTVYSLHKYQRRRTWQLKPPAESPR